ncbi:MAG TPA: hypothetical protein PLB18_23300, partial [Acidobacteriota bacterium]|nr:hypothetical protein [Acidobacteriota bacterium]
LTEAESQHTTLSYSELFAIADARCWFSKIDAGNGGGSYCEGRMMSPENGRRLNATARLQKMVKRSVQP